MMNDVVILNYFFLQLDNPLQFGLGRIKEIEGFFIAEINDREK